MKEVARIVGALGVLALVPEDMEIYAFGTAVRDLRAANDLDLLLVYPDGDVQRAHRVATRIRQVAPEGTIDLLAMSRKEERETSFVLDQAAVLLDDQ